MLRIRLPILTRSLLCPLSCQTIRKAKNVRKACWQRLGISSRIRAQRSCKAKIMKRSKRMLISNRKLPRSTRSALRLANRVVILQNLRVFGIKLLSVRALLVQMKMKVVVKCARLRIKTGLEKKNGFFNRGPNLAEF